MKYIGTYKIPEYAVCAIEYGDFTGVSDEDEKDIKDFLSKEFPNGYVADWQTDEPYFTSCPAFGQATTVIDAEFYEP